LLCRIDASGRGIVMAEAVSSDWPSLANRELPSHLLAYYRQETSLEAFISTPDTDAAYANTLPMLLQTLQRWRVKAEVVVPIKHSETLWGFIIIHQCRSARRWDTADMQCLRQAALHISISIEQTELQRKNQELLEVHRKTEQMLCVQQEQITHVLSSSPGILYSCLAQNNYQRIFFGKNLEELLGYSVFEAIETDFWAHHIHPEDLPNVQFCSTQPHLSQEYRIQHKDGSYRWLYDQQKVVFDEQGVPLEWIGYLVDITERKQVEEQLKRSLQEKDVLLREIHHRVKNNLNVIIGLLNLQASYVEDDEVVEMFTHSKNRIRTMALLHEQLYRSEDLGRIEVSSYIEQLVDNLAAAYEDRASQIDFCLNIVPVALNIETAIPCGLLINELVTNSFKYAFPEGQAGKISITLARVNQHLDLTIQDDGIGLPPNLDIQSCPSLGLRLVRLLALQLGAEFTLDKPSIGTCFHLVFSELAYDARL
ncbi:MAG TPA: histidine kinase dimerization/phosphoacceptor domain -containing protein, partial [Stenomitos sp.]